jgi:hypothetical protein
LKIIIKAKIELEKAENKSFMINAEHKLVLHELELELKLEPELELRAYRI